MATKTADETYPKIVECKTQRFFGIVGGGPFDSCGLLFQKLAEIAKTSGLQENRTAMLVLCDVPNTSKPDLVWACAIQIPEGSDPPLPDGLEEIIVPGRRCATTIHRGAYEGLPKAWGSLCMKWVPSQNLQPLKGSRDNVHYEVYLKCCDHPNQEESETQLFCPVEAAPAPAVNE